MTIIMIYGREKDPFFFTGVEVLDCLGPQKDLLLIFGIFSSHMFQHMRANIIMTNALLWTQSLALIGRDNTTHWQLPNMDTHNDEFKVK